MQEVTNNGKNCIGIMASSKFNAIGVVVLGAINAVGAVAVSILNALGLVTFLRSTPLVWSLSAG